MSFDGYDSWKTTEPQPDGIGCTYCSSESEGTRDGVPSCAECDEDRKPCAHPLVELLSLDGRTLDDALRICADCHCVTQPLTDTQVEAIRRRALKQVKVGWEQHTDILVACEDALLGGPTSRAAREQVAKLLADKAVR